MATGGLPRLLLGIVLGAALTAGSALGYLYFGTPPVAVSDRAVLWEHLVGGLPTQRRIAAEAKTAPFPASEDVFEAAAQTYRASCAQCHGLPWHDAAIGRQMLPHAQQFFGHDRKSTAARPAGELFWPTAFGIRRSGMPAYNRTLTNTQMWQLALLLHSADQDLPNPVTRLLTDPPPAASLGTSVANPQQRPLRNGHTSFDKEHLAPSERPESQF